MGDEEEADYQAALAGDQTELAPSEVGTQAQAAWSLDESPDYKPPFWTAGRITGLVVGGAVVAAIGAAGFAGYHLRGAEPTPPPKAEPIPQVVIPPTPEPRDGRWFVSPDDPRDIRHGSYSDTEMREFDQVFLTLLRGDGWAPTEPQFVAAVGKGVCAEYALGTSKLDVIDKLRARYSDGDVTLLVAAAELSYPDCDGPD